MRILQILYFLTFTFSGMCQVNMSLEEAENLLQKNNLLLLAEQYNINAAKAQAIQAKIWEQPYLTADVNAVNPQDNRFLDIGRRGQKGLAAEQMIYLGGKKKNELAVAKSNIQIAEKEFEILLRNLKFQLINTFYSLYFEKQKITTLDNQIAMLDSLIANYTVQANRGNISLREVARLQTLVLTFRQNKIQLQKDISEGVQMLTLLTGTEENINPLIDEKSLLSSYLETPYSKEEITRLALSDNPEFIIWQNQLENRELELKWQKSLSTPDITAGLAYDQRGGAFNNQLNVTLGIPLPLWNKNKGNIAVAQAQLEQTRHLQDFKKLELQSLAENYFIVWQQLKEQYMKVNENTGENLEVVYAGILSNFRNRNITLLEFTDFMESYNEVNLLQKEIVKSLILSGVRLNFITNRNIF